MLQDKNRFEIITNDSLLFECVVAVIVFSVTELRSIKMQFDLAAFHILDPLRTH